MASIHSFPQAFSEQETAALFHKYLPVRALPEDMEKRLLSLVSRTVQSEFSTASQSFVTWLRSFVSLAPQHYSVATPLLVIGSILILIVSFYWSRPNTRPIETALLRSTSGEVTVIRQNEAEPILVAANDQFEVASGDRIGTKESGVTLELFAGQLAQIAANSLVEIRTLDEQKDETIVELFVEHGLVHSEISPELQKPTVYRILSHVATVTVNGTIFDVGVESPTRASVIAYMGEVAVESNGQAIILTTGQQVQAIIGQPLIVERVQLPKPVAPIPLVEPATPIATVVPTATAISVTVTACDQLVQDGGFEQGKSWTLPPTGFSAAYVNDIAHIGSTSVRLGIPESSTNIVSYSSVYQNIQLPTVASRITLRLMAWQAADLSLSDKDLQYIWLIQENGTIVRLWQGTVDSHSWQPMTIDLSSYIGEHIQLLMGVFNDGIYGKSVMYIDSVEVDGC